MCTMEVFSSTMNNGLVIIVLLGQFQKDRYGTSLCVVAWLLYRYVQSFYIYMSAFKPPQTLFGQMSYLNWVRMSPRLSRSSFPPLKVDESYKGTKSHVVSQAQDKGKVRVWGPSANWKVAHIGSGVAVSSQRFYVRIKCCCFWNLTGQGGLERWLNS